MSAGAFSLCGGPTKGFALPTMDDQPISLSRAAAEALTAEIARLQGEVEKLEARVRELDEIAYVDALVNLPNRRSFLADLQHLIAHVERYKEPAAMIFIDVDGLKRINDRFGHPAGDAALIEIAGMLLANVRKSDRVARLAGDEFGILMPSSDELGAWQMALRIVETVVGAQFCVDGQCLPLSVAVGVGVVEPGDTPESVIARADHSMYRMKAA
jgi:diguanylate cyclase (GGDEF)-like protein